MTKYKVGDLVTFMLKDQNAINLSQGMATGVCCSQITNHEPTPDPIVEYINAHIGSFGFICGSKEDADSVSRGVDRLACIKLTYDPATKKASVEVCDE